MRDLLSKYEVTIRGTVTKTIEVLATSEDDATERAHEQFTVKTEEGVPEDYGEITIGVKNNGVCQLSQKEADELLTSAAAIVVDEDEVTYPCLADEADDDIWLEINHLGLLRQFRREDNQLVSYNAIGIYLKATDGEHYLISILNQQTLD